MIHHLILHTNALYLHMHPSTCSFLYTKPELLMQISADDGIYIAVNCKYR